MGLFSYEKKYSLRSFLRNQLLKLVSCIVVSFAVIILYLYVDGLDIATKKTLSVIGGHYAQLYSEGELQGESYEAGEFSVFIGQENLPEWVTQKFPQTSFINYDLHKDHYSRLSDDRHRAPLMVMAMPLANSERQVFAVYHFLPHKLGPSELEPPFVIETVLVIAVSVFLALLAAVFWIATRFTRRVLRPMESLAEMAREVDEKAPDASHPIFKDPSEMGLVAHSLKQSMERIHAYHLREKNFLQNASHELRTPITVVGSALDIIQRRLELGKPDISKPLTHIRQATLNMRETTEALLWLSRGDEQVLNPQQTAQLQKADDIDALAHQVVEQLGHLIEGRDIEVRVSISGQTMPADLALVRIVLSNLVRNAFEHTFEGQVHIEVSDVGLRVIDTGLGLTEGLEPLNRGESGRDSFGLGLDIVTRIADKKGWTLAIENNPDGGCIASLKWSFR